MSMTPAARASAGSTLSAPVRARGKGRKRAAPTLGSRLLKLVWQRPGRAMLLLAFSAVAAAILINALFYQTAAPPRPAPAARAPAVAPAQPRLVAPAPVAAPERAAVPPAEVPAQPNRIEDLLAPGNGAVLPPPRPGQRPQQAQPSRPAAASVAAPVARRVETPAPAAPAPARPAVTSRDPIGDLINDLRPPGEIRGRPASR